MNDRIKDILDQPIFERLRDWVEVGPVQRATLESFADRIALDCLWEVIKDSQVPQDIQVLIGERIKQRFGVK